MSYIYFTLFYNYFECPCFKFIQHFLQTPSKVFSHQTVTILIPVTLSLPKRMSI